MSTPAWINALPSGIVKTDLLTYASNNVLTYTAALQILTDVENQGPVTAAEFSDLQTLANNLNNGLSASPYVASIFTQLVDGSPANATWNGGATSSTPLGNLQAGTTSAQMSELIGQWFLGTNLPDPSLPQGSTWQLTGYSTASGSLYGPSAAAAVGDVCQGADGDCELLAGMIEYVENHPQELASMIVANGNGTYGVRFYVNGNEVWETVNASLPSGPEGLVYGHNLNEQNTALWVGLVEKAYAQLSATGEIGHPAIDSYNNVAADPATEVFANLFDASNVQYYDSSSSNWVADKIIYIDAVTGGDDVVLETGSDAADTYDGSGNIELVGDHAFAVIGYDSSTGDFIVRNPWGTSYTGQNWDAQFEVSLSDIAGVDGDFAIGADGGGGSLVVIHSAPEEILSTGSTSLSSLFSAADIAGRSMTEYNVQVLGSGTIQLNGAANLATSAQTALGQIVVSAANLSALTLSATSSTGTVNLLVSAYDGSSWSATAVVPLTISNISAAVMTSHAAPLAPGQTVGVSTLFSYAGTLASGDAWISFIVPAGGGTINLNGAANDWSGATAGEYEISADQLSMVTYTAPGSAQAVSIQFDIYSGSGWSPWQTVGVNLGDTVATALLDDADGQLSGDAYVVDTAANVFANLNSLQALFAAGTLQGVSLTNLTTQTVSVDQQQYDQDRGVISLVSGPYTVMLAGLADELNGDGRSDILLESTSGQVVVGELSGGQEAYTGVAALGSEWTFHGAGDFKGDGKAAFLIENTQGYVYIGEVNGSSTSYTGLAAIGPEWSFEGNGDFLGVGASQFLIENTSGTIDLGKVVGGVAQFTTVGSLGSDWKFVGTGDYLDDGKDQFLIEDTAGYVYVGEVNGSGTSTAYTGLSALGPEWKFVESGDFMGDGRTDYLIENTQGYVYIGEYNGSGVTYTNAGALGSEWSFVGAGDYSGTGKDSFMIEDTAGDVYTGTMVSGAIQFAKVTALGSQWKFHG